MACGMQARTALKLTLLAILSLVLVALLIIAAGQLEVSDSRLAFDWKIIHAGLNDTDNHWSGGLFNPPWVVLALLPFGSLPVTLGWLIVMLFSLAVIVIGVQPKRSGWKFAAAAILVVAAFPTMRSLVDGNIDALAIAGVLLLMAGSKRRSGSMLAVGALAAAAKPQATWMVIILIGIQLFRERAWRTLAVSVTLISIVVALTMLWGGADWLGSVGRVGSGIALRGLLMSATESPVISLVVIALVALATLWGAVRSGASGGNINYGLLVAGSLLTAPYGNALSLTGVILLGVVPLVFARPLLGVPVYLLFITPYFGLGDVIGLDQLVYRYLSLALLVAWAALLAHVLLTTRMARGTSSAPLTEPAPADHMLT